MIKALSVFTNGDSGKISTWSNVPYLLTETLISRGIRVHRVDLSESGIIRRVFNRTIMPFIRRLQPQTSYSYCRSPIHFAGTRRRIRRAIRMHPDSDANIFLSFSFSSAKLTAKPTVLLCDWPYYHYVEHFLGRKLDRFERASAHREAQQIEGADLVVSLYPGVANRMRDHFANRGICYLGNVVNSMSPPDPRSVREQKMRSMDILFIGRSHYIRGAQTVTAAVSALRKEHGDLTLHIIGMKPSDFPGELPAGVKCYGYLDKADLVQRQTYYDLLRKAKVFVNTNPKWGAFSAMLEAMYHFVPIVTAPYDECLATFGERPSFGSFCSSESTEALISHLKSILETENYECLCYNAHKAVKDFSWAHYADQLSQRINDQIQKLELKPR